MYAQLGTTIFDGLKSFVSFSGEEEAIIVEHALISKKSKLQGTAIGLRNISISLFLHQEFCKVSEETAKLRASMSSFEILPLLWGNGKLEGEFVIASMSVSKNQMDSIGNTVSANISLSLKESTDDNKPKRDAFAVGEKTPPAKSNRTNNTSCNQKVADIITIIKNNADRVDFYSRQYINSPVPNKRLISHLTIISNNAQKLIDAASAPSSCVHGVSGFLSNAQNVKAKAGFMQQSVQDNVNGYINPLFVPNISGVKSDNTNLQQAVKSLAASANKVIKVSITNK